MGSLILGIQKMKLKFFLHKVNPLPMKAHYSLDWITGLTYEVKYKHTIFSHLD
jgi:hypothetical protein